MKLDCSPSLHFWPSYHRAGTELGRHPLRGEERARGPGRHWEPIPQDLAKDPGQHRTRGQV